MFPSLSAFGLRLPSARGAGHSICRLRDCDFRSDRAGRQGHSSGSGDKLLTGIPCPGRRIQEVQSAETVDYPCDDACAPGLRVVTTEAPPGFQSRTQASVTEFQYVIGDLRSFLLVDNFAPFAGRAGGIGASATCNEFLRSDVDDEPPRRRGKDTRKCEILLSPDHGASVISFPHAADVNLVL